MKYELYIDIFFLENLMMDFLVLVLLKKMLKNPSSYRRVFFGALTGATLACVGLILPVKAAVLRILILYLGTGIGMLKVGVKLQGLREHVRAGVFLGVASVLLGGVMEFFAGFLRVGSLFFLLAGLGYWISLGVWSLLEALAERNQMRCEIVLYRGGSEIRVKALIDTGNQLHDTLTEKPVSIITPDTAARLNLSKLPEISESIRFLPYTSIGNPNGVLPIFCIDEMCVFYRKKSIEVKEPILAVCGNELNSDDYQMILHPEILKGRK